MWHLHGCKQTNKTFEQWVKSNKKMQNLKLSVLVTVGAVLLLGMGAPCGAEAIIWQEVFFLILPAALQA